MERHNMYKLEHNINTGEIVEIPLTQEEIDMMNNDHQKFKQIHEEKMESKQSQDQLMLQQMLKLLLLLLLIIPPQMVI